MNRTKAENRHNSYIKALRKQRIARDVYCGDVDYYDNLHQYSKNKIHCSCSLCSSKTRNKGDKRKRPGNYSKSLNYKVSDLRKIEKLKDDLQGD